MLMVCQNFDLYDILFCEIVVRVRLQVFKKLLHLLFGKGHCSASLQFRIG